MTGSHDELEQRVTTHLQERWNASTEALLAAETGPVDADAVLARVLAGVAMPANDVAPPPSRRRWITATSLGLAAAAAIVIAAWPRERGPALQYVEDSFEGGLKTVRKDEPAATTAVVALLPTSSIRWVLAPMEATKVDVDVRLAITGATTACLVVPSKGLRVVASGAIEISGTAEDLVPLSAGSYTMTALVGTRDDIGDADDPCRVDADGTRPPGITAVASRRIELRTE